MTNALIAFFALYRDVQSLIFCGALFHALVASLMNVDVDFSDVPSSMSFPRDIDLEHLVPFDDSIFLMIGGS